MEMPFEDLNTKMENSPEQAEKDKGFLHSGSKTSRKKKKKRFVNKTNVSKGSHLWPLTYTLSALFISSTANSQIRFL